MAASPIEATDGAANLAAPPEEEKTAFGVPIDDLSKEERLKLEENPLEIWDKILAAAAADKPPEGGDIFRFKFHGLFYVAPNQDSFMLRVRVAGGVLSTRQLHGLAAIARGMGGGYGDITTRANLQLREFPPRNIAKVMMAIADLGMTSRGAGADNIRNITATPTSGIDPQELYDVRPLVKALQYYIGNCRDLYGLPRKFNIAFDTGGAVSTVSDTNDIGFVATRVGEDAGIEPGIYFRVLLAGITGHKRFAVDSGLLLKSEECVAVAAALVRVFNETGDRTDRKKARLCYAIERIGIDGFLAKTEEKLAFPLRRLAAERSAPPKPVTRHGYLGVHKQSQPGLYYIGVRVPVGRMTADQMDEIAAIMESCGDGECRLTVWQNLILSGIREDSAGGGRRAARSHRLWDERFVGDGRDRRLHRQYRLPLLLDQHQGPGTGDRRLSRRTPDARPADQHPPDRLPELLRPALYRRHRSARHHGGYACRPGRGLSCLCRRRLRPRARIGA